MPILTNPTSVATGQTTANGSVTTDTTIGIIYAIVTQSPKEPTGAQVKAGLNEFGGPADWSFTFFVTVGFLTATFSAFGLAPATTYYFHFMHEVAHSGQSAVVSSPSFTTQTPDVIGSGRDRSRNTIVRGTL